jgi:hypothetical protein
MTQVRYTICNQVEKRKKLLILKLDGLQKHVVYYKATFARLGVVVSECYMSSSNQHVKNELHYATFHGQVFLVQQIANGDLVENKRKLMQFITIFHLLKQKRPMTNFKGCKELFNFFNPWKHWTNITSWTWLKPCMILCFDLFIC